ncbi:hypothetical protein TKK_0005379 [Trichogramma kaykai]|uniref:Rho GTPase-activating protein 100F n=1 Tax=Trichogramma kaykai TaxID=54128 RepID=A0ABD2XIH7_9HYME
MCDRGGTGCFFYRKQEGRGDVTDITASPGRQTNVNQLRPKDPPPMVIQGDFRKVSGITSEIFRQLETIENDHDASTAAALEAVEKHGEMVVRIIEPRQLGRHASEAAKKFIAIQDSKHPIHFVEIIKRPGQTLGLYIREGNGLDRNDGVFISRIAVETAVYNSGCLKVGDEILAVNLVDVTHMSLDDVVIIMSIPRRLLLAIRHGPHQLVGGHNRCNEQKGPPVVVIKKELNNEDETDHHHHQSQSQQQQHHMSTLERDRRRGDGREMLPSRSKLGLAGLGSSHEINQAMASNGDLYYNSRPESQLGWSYQPPPPPVITQQPKPGPQAQHFQPYDRGYPKTLESLAEKVHSFYPSTTSIANGSSSRRMSAGQGMHTIGRMGSSGGYAAYGQPHSAAGRLMPRSGSDQHLPRVDYTSITTPARHTLLRSSLKTGGSAALRYGSRYGMAGNDLLSSGVAASGGRGSQAAQYGTLTRRHHQRPSLDYASDTEATCSSSPRSAYYYYRHNMNNPQPSSAVSHLATLSRSQLGSTAKTLRTHVLGLRSNSLPRSVRTLPGGHQQGGLRSGISTLAQSLIDEDDGALSAPEMPSIRQDRGRIPSSTSVFTSDEYKAWLSRTPSTSALYDQIRSTSSRPPRYTYSAENIHAAVNQADYATYGYRPYATSTLDRLSHRSASAQQVNLANLRASTAISSAVAAAAASSGHHQLGGGGGLSGVHHSRYANPRVTSSALVASNVRAALASKNTLGSAASQRANSIRRMRGMAELEPSSSSTAMTHNNNHHSAVMSALAGGRGAAVGAGVLGAGGAGSTSTPTRPIEQRLLDINPAEFLKYKIEKPAQVGTPSSTTSSLLTLAENQSSSDFVNGVSGLLWVHLLAGRGLRVNNPTNSAVTTPGGGNSQQQPGLNGNNNGNANNGSNGSLVNCALRDLYCVLECDRVHKARTVVRTGDLMFDWDENFELDLVGNRQLDLLVYSWDPQYRHKLCYKGSVYLPTLFKESPLHQLAVKVEPRGTIYLRLRYTDANQTFRRRCLPVVSLAGRIAPLFGIDLETVVSREAKTGGVPGGVSTALAMGGSGVPNVPIIIWRCVEEVERRGLDIIGLYRLCGSATKKRILREAFERNARSVDLSSDNVPDINVITGVLKDYLRELPEPLFTKCLYQMMVDALGVCLPDDPQGNAKLMFSILDCLPTVNKCTLIYLLDHLAMVISQCNKMSPGSLAVCFGPVLMLHSDDTGAPLDFTQPIAVLKYLLEIWPVKSVRKITSVVSTLPRTTSTANSNSSNSSSNHPPVSSASQLLHQHLMQQQQQQQQQHDQQSSIQQSPQQPPSQQPQRSPQQPAQPQPIHQSQQAQQQSQSPLRGTLPRTGLPWQQQPSPHQQHQPTSITTSSSNGSSSNSSNASHNSTSSSIISNATSQQSQSTQQHQQAVASSSELQQQQPTTTTTMSRPPPPPPVKPRQQVIVSSPGSPSSEEPPSSSSYHPESAKGQRGSLANSYTTESKYSGSRPAATGAAGSSANPTGNNPYQDSSSVGSRFNRAVPSVPTTAGSSNNASSPSSQQTQDSVRFNRVAQGTTGGGNSSPQDSVRFNRVPTTMGSSPSGTQPQESVRFNRSPLAGPPGQAQQVPPTFNRVVPTTAGSPSTQQQDSMRFNRASNNAIVSPNAQQQQDAMKFTRSPVSGATAQSNSLSQEPPTARYNSTNAQPETMRFNLTSSQQDSARFASHNSGNQQDSPRFNSTNSQPDTARFNFGSQQDSARYGLGGGQQDSVRYNPTGAQQESSRYNSIGAQPPDTIRFNPSGPQQSHDSVRYNASGNQPESLKFNLNSMQPDSAKFNRSPTIGNSAGSYQDSSKYVRSPAGTSPISYQDALSKFSRIQSGNNGSSSNSSPLPAVKPRVHSTNPFLNSMSNGNGSGNGHGGGGVGVGVAGVLPSINFFGNGTGELVTPTSSVDTEDGATGAAEEAERGVEGDIEASDDDCFSKMGGGKP